jgi:phage terminase large subunit GpA-like protein
VEIPASVRSCLAPRERTHPREWLPKHIYFSSKDGAVPGYWSHARFPYSAGVLDAFVDPTISEVVLMWATQLGKTALLTALVSYIACMSPSPLMIACPDQASAHEYYKTKLEPALESCSAVSDRLLPKRDRNMELVDLGDMWVYFGWSGAKRTLSARSIRFLYVTELGLWSYTKDREGDPLKMARDRTKAFPNRVIFIEGKPTIKGECRLTDAYNESDQRTYHVPCPHCGEYQVLRLGTYGIRGGLRWEKLSDGHSDPLLARRTAFYECEHCVGRIEDRHKLSIMLPRGIWARRGMGVRVDGSITGEPENPGRIAGFHLNSLYSSLLSFGEVAEEFVRASHGSIMDLQAYVNSWLAEAFELRGKRFDLDDVLSHRCEHQPNHVPDKDSRLVCTVDVQKDCLYYVIRAWGPNGNSWLIRYGQLPRDDQSDFAKLLELLSHAYRGPEGSEFRVGLVLIDSGYAARQSEVYEFCQANQWPKCIPCRGRPQSGSRNQTSILHCSKVPDRDLDLWWVDAQQGNNQLFDRRFLVKVGDPGYWALHSETGADYAKHFLSVTRSEEENRKTGQRQIVWRQVSRDDHYLDCERAQEAAAFHYGFSFMKPTPEEPKETTKDARPEPRQRSTMSGSGYRRRDGRGWLDR